MRAIADRIGRGDAFVAMCDEAYAYIRAYLTRSPGERSSDQSANCSRLITNRSAINKKK
jgi:hypothetical protein